MMRTCPRSMGATMIAVAQLWLAATNAGCSLLGTPASPPGPSPHAGTGQFRNMTTDETGIGAVPQGATIILSSTGVDNGMAAEGHFFYAAGRAIPVDAGMPDSGMPDADVDADVDAGDPLDAGEPVDAGVDAAMSPDASMPDAGLPPERDAVDWARFEPRRIFHSPPGEAWGFTPGTVVLEAEEAWEGGYVTDPWVVERADGSFLLFYAAAGGIGVARASQIGGPYTRDSAPLIAAVGSDVPRRATVVRTADLEGAPAVELLVYYELAGQIHVGTFDGSAFDELATLEPPALPQRDDRDGDEIAVGAPGAGVVVTPSGRSVVRVYYESRRSNGTTLIALMATADGQTFDFFDRPVFAERNRQAPSPRQVDGRTTILYAWIPNRQNGAIINALTPTSSSLVDVPPGM